MNILSLDIFYTMKIFFPIYANNLMLVNYKIRRYQRITKFFDDLKLIYSYTLNPIPYINCID